MTESNFEKLLFGMRFCRIFWNAILLKQPTNNQNTNQNIYRSDLCLCVNMLVSAVLIKLSPILKNKYIFFCIQLTHQTQESVFQMKKIIRGNITSEFFDQLK